MEMFYTTWFIFCLMPVAALAYIFFTRDGNVNDLVIKPNMPTWDIEFSGGPDDGHKTLTLSLDDIIYVDMEHPLYKHAYKHTNRVTTSGFIIYEYIGTKPVGNISSLSHQEEGRTF